MYGDTNNRLRHQIYSEENGKLDAKCIPPCRDVMNQHLKRANYQAAIWRKSLDQDPQTPYSSWLWLGAWVGWDKLLGIYWTSVMHAPQQANADVIVKYQHVFALQII